jgi:hypothetical protein
MREGEKIKPESSLGAPTKSAASDFEVFIEQLTDVFRGRAELMIKLNSAWVFPYSPCIFGHTSYSNSFPDLHSSRTSPRTRAVFRMQENLHHGHKISQ